MQSIENIFNLFTPYVVNYGKEIKKLEEKLKKDIDFDHKNDEDPDYDEKYERFNAARRKLRKTQPYRSWLIISNGFGRSGYEGKEDDVHDYFLRLEQKTGLYYSEEFKELLTWIGVEKGDFWGSKEFGRFLGLPRDSQGFKYHPEFRDQISSIFEAISDLFPPFFIKYAYFYNALDSENFMFSWHKHEEHQQSEVFIFNLVDRTIIRFSNSLSNLLLRGLECVKALKIQNVYEPSEDVLQIIRNIDGDNVLPNESAVYELDELDSFPEEWKVMLTEEDYDFEL